MSDTAERAQRPARVRPHTSTDEWWTPPHITDALGLFDLDPCAPEASPSHTGAARSFTASDDGLSQPWHGRVWLNPPYSNAGPWVAKLADHGDGVALIFVRCETRWWFDHVWPKADAFLFLQGRVGFVRGDGADQVGHNAAAPSVLVAYGVANADALARCSLPGAQIHRGHPFLFAGVV